MLVSAGLPHPSMAVCQMRISHTRSAKKYQKRPDLRPFCGASVDFGNIPRLRHGFPSQCVLAYAQRTRNHHTLQAPKKIQDRQQATAGSESDFPLQNPTDQIIWTKSGQSFGFWPLNAAVSIISALFRAFAPESSMNTSTRGRVWARLMVVQVLVVRRGAPNFSATE